MGDDMLTRGIFHLNYEVACFVGATLWRAESITVPKTPSGVFIAHAMKNGPLELRALHARNLIEFLLSNRPKTEEYRADEYFADWVPPDRRALQGLHARACAHVSHLAKSRVTDKQHASGERDKSWSLDDFAPLLRALVSFLDRLLASNHVAPHAEERAALTQARGLICEMLLTPAAVPPMSPTGAAGPMGKESY